MANGEQTGLPEGWVIDESHAPSAPASATGEGAMSRFSGAALGALTSPLHFAQSLLTDPKGTYDQLVNQSAEHFEKASQLWKEKQYGPAVHRAIAGVVPPYGIVPETADQLRSGDLAGAAGTLVGTAAIPRVYGAAVRGVRAAPAAARTVAHAIGPEGAAQLVKHGATATGAATLGTPGAILGSQIGEALADRLRARLAPVKPAGAPPQVAGKAPALTDQLKIVLDELRQEPPPEPGTGAPAVTTTAAGKPAVTATQYEQMTRGGPSVSAEGRGAQPQYRSLEEAMTPGMGPTEGLPTGEPAARIPTPPVDLTSQLETSSPLRPQDVAQARTAERFGKVYTSEGGPGRPSVPRDPMMAVHQAARSAAVKLTAEESSEAAKFVKRGLGTPEEAMTALQIVRALKASPSFANLPTAAEMQADLTQRAVSGQKSLMPKYGPEPGGNPFR